MSDSIHSRPYSDQGRANYDRIFRKSDPVHSLTPGTIREYRSDCCGAEIEYEAAFAVCTKCGKPCTTILTKIN